MKERERDREGEREREREGERGSAQDRVGDDGQWLDWILVNLSISIVLI